MSVLSTIFSWFKTKDEQVASDPIRQSPRRPQNRDWTDQYQINSALTQGLFHNTYPGFKLAGSLAYVPIMVPLYLMGLPSPLSEDESTQDELNQIVEDHSNDCHMNHLLSHRDATSWIWPFYSTALGKDIWEFIPDDIVSDIIRDLNTGEVKMIITDEVINISTGENVTATVRRKRIFTAQTIGIQWTENATGIQGLVSGKFKNPTGCLPIPFANNRDGDAVRGHSDYERILSDLKNYHDTDLALSQLLAKFQPKMVQEVQDVSAWLSSNAITDIAAIDIATIDFIINLSGKEKTSFEWPQGAHDAAMAKLSQIFWKLVQGSGIPELLWGTKVEGNMASADNQLDAVIKFVEDKQRQKNESYKKLITATAQLRNIAHMKTKQPIISEMKWNALDLLSQQAKAQVFMNFASGISSLINCAGITKAQTLKMWEKFFPTATEEDYDTFVEGISEMAKHKSFQNTPYETIADMTGIDDVIKPPEPAPVIVAPAPGLPGEKNRKGIM